MDAPIIGISRHRIHTDGQGVTSLVCFHGCPLRCQYCLNPFSFAPDTKFTIMTPSELYEKVRIDELYFLATGGGIAFGGGEPLLRAEFIQEFRRLCGPDWFLMAETSLAVPREQVAIAAQCMDHFLIDVKDTNPAIYRRYTGQDNALVLENLAFLASLLPSEKITIRLPLIPEFNTEEDCQKSRERLTDLGLTQFDCFTYKTK